MTGPNEHNHRNERGPTGPVHAGIDLDRVPQAELLAMVERAVGETYRVERLAGAGGQSHVYAGRELGTGQRVAIKLLRVRDPSPGLDPSLGLHRRLVSEARSMSRLDHPSLCRVREVSVQGDLPFIVMDWAAGVPLDRFWDRLGRRQRLGLLLRVVDAIAAAHHQGVVHGDIKPANILVKKDGTPTIVDFGLARCEHDLPLGTASLGGTPGFSALEQFDGQSEITPATDVFALGVLLYLLLTGRTPYPEDDSPAIMVERMRRVDPQLPETIREDTPTELQKICLQALEREPVLRYADASAMATDLRRYLRREPVEARPSILVRRFESQLLDQLDTTREWLRLGLIGPDDAARLLRRLESLRLSNARQTDRGRLTPARAALQLGALVVIIALLATPWIAAPAAPLAIGAGTVAIAMLAAGAWLRRTDRPKVAMAAFAAGFTAAPIAVWMTTRLADDAAHTARWRDVLIGSAGLRMSSLPSDPHLLIIASAATFIGVLTRVLSGSSLFTLAASACGVLTWLAVLAIIGTSGAASSVALFAEAGPSLAVFGVALMIPGLSIDWWRQRDLARFRSPGPGHHDGTALLGVAGVLIPLGLLVSAFAVPARFQAADAFAVVGAGMIVSAAGLGVVAFITSLRATPVRARLTEAFLILAPAELFAGLALLALRDAAALGWLWTLALAGVGVAAAYAAAELKRRSLMLAAQVGVGLAAMLLMHSAATRGAGVPTTLAIIAAGLSVMALAWWLPVYLARRQLSRWASRAVSMRSRSVGRSRTWRG